MNLEESEADERDQIETPKQINLIMFKIPGKMTILKIQILSWNLIHDKYTGVLQLLGTSC